MSPMKQNEFYCVAIRQRVTQKDKDICVVMMKNKKVPGGVPALRSTHAMSNSTMYKFIARSSYDQMVSKYGKC
jgi:hypothetical protein